MQMTLSTPLRTALLALVLLLAGCGASGQPFSTASIAPPKSGAMLYLYRPKTIIGIGNPDVSFVHLDGKPLTRLRIGGYLALPLKPGSHEILATTSLLGADTGNVRAKAVVNVPPAGRIFVRYSEAYKGFVPIILPKVGAVITQMEFRFDEVPESEALGELADTKALELDKPS
jgi:hypothetical protein